MNKTVTINISGIIFHIEEDAYVVLSQYLNTIKSYFSSSDGGSEIMADIEARIAEMLQGKTSALKQVVLMSDVNDVMESMGKPEEFASDEQTNEFSKKQSGASGYGYSDQIPKRLYRDADNKILGGVCSGIGHYFDFDPVWLRIALLLLVIFAGTGVLVYAILWIAIPEAKTLSEKFAMRGEKADINNISKAVKDEAEELKKRMKKYGEDFKTRYASKRTMPRNSAEKFIDFIIDIMLSIGKVIYKIIGFFLLFFGIFFFFVLSGSVFGTSFFSGNIEGKEWIDMLFLDGRDFYIGFIGVIIFIGAPVVMMIYGGVKILFRIHYSNRWINLAAGIVWLTGLFMLLYVGARTLNDFSSESKVRQNVPIKSYETLFLKMNQIPVDKEELILSYHDDEDTDEDFSTIQKFKGYALGRKNNSKYLLGTPQLNIIKSQSDKLELVIVKESNGSDKKIATERAKNISYEVIQTDSIIMFDDLFKILNAGKFRNQKITAILKLPIGQIIYLDKSLEHLLYDVENVSNTSDIDMIKRRWMMTKAGLKCIDCSGINTEADETNDNQSSTHADEYDEIGDSTKVKKHSQINSVTIDGNGIHFKRQKK